MNMNPRVTLKDRIRHDFTNHPPETPEVGYRLDDLTAEAIRFGDVLIAEVPESRELSMALTKLEECLMHAKAGVARNQDRIG